MPLYVCSNCLTQILQAEGEPCPSCLLADRLLPKRAYWEAQIGNPIHAQNYRGEVGQGILVSVRGGVWGYGGDSVALQLSVADPDGQDTWPAGKCKVMSDLND